VSHAMARLGPQAEWADTHSYTHPYTCVYIYIYVYTHIYPLYTNTSRARHASTPALPARAAGWPWLQAQGSARGDVRFYRPMLEAAGVPPSCCPGLHPTFPALPQLRQIELTGVHGSISARKAGCFPVRGSCFYLTPFQLPKLARTGSCSVCLGRRCIAANYF